MANQMETPRVCGISGETITQWSDLIWTDVYDKETKEYKNVPSHISKKAFWELSKSSPTHPSNIKEVSEDVQEEVEVEVMAEEAAY